MDKPRFVYVTYIAAPPKKVWSALLDAKMTTRYWQHVNESDWRPGSRWEHRAVGARRALHLVGKVVQCRPPKRLVITWAFPQDEERKDKHSRVTFELSPHRGVTRLTVTHDRLEPRSEMLQGITYGWPIVLSSLKSLLETGKPLPKLW